MTVSGIQETHAKGGWRADLRKGVLFRNMRIRNKALLIFIVAGLIPLILTNIFAYAQAASNIKSTIEWQDLQFAQTTREHLANVFGNLQAVGSSLALDQTVFGAFDVKAGDVGTGAWFTIAYPSLELLLPEVTRQFGGVALIFLTDISATCIYTTGNKTMKSALEGYDLESNAALDIAIDSSLAGQQTWSQLTYFEPIKSNVFILSSPVHSAGHRGNIVGTINVLVDQQHLDTLVLDNIGTLGQTADAYCIAADGTLLTNMKHHEYSTGSALQIKLNDTATAELESAIQKGRMDFTEVFEYKDNNGNMILAYLMDVPLGETPAGLVVRVNEYEAFAQVTQLRNILLIAVASVACLGSVISINIARMLSNPTNKLLAVVKEMANGNTALTPEVEGKDEIGSLAAGIGEVVHNHEKLIQTILDAKNKLAESEKRYRELTDLLPVIVYEIDSEGKLTFLNRAGLDFMGYSLDDLRNGVNLFQMVAPESWVLLRERAQKIINGETDTNSEYAFVKKDGTRFPAAVYSSRIIEDGRPAGLRGVFVDMTERRQMEARLAETQRLAAIGETAAWVGHDLRNPLQAMVGSVYLVKRFVKSEKDEEKEQAVNLLNTLDDQVSYMDKIVADLQDYARPVGASVVETNLTTLIKNTAANQQVPQNIEVNVNVQPEASKLMLDPTLFRRVLTNLIINAVQAMPQGGKLTISASKFRGFLTVTVQDTGVGIAPENFEKLFHPFFTTKAKGQGLGLAVCKRLVEAQGGTITAESELDKGSKFTFKVLVNESTKSA